MYAGETGEYNKGDKDFDEVLTYFGVGANNVSNEENGPKPKSNKNQQSSKKSSSVVFGDKFETEQTRKALNDGLLDDKIISEKAGDLGDAGLAAIFSMIPLEIGGLDFTKFKGLSIAEEYGIGEYKSLAKLTKGLDVEVHHLIEKRFASVFGEKASEMYSIVLTKAEHQAFTNAWRSEIGYSGSKALVTTANATKIQIENAARVIYKNYPVILSALGL